MTIVWAGLAPHPPVIVPTVGKTRLSQVAATVDAMKAWSRDCMAADPQRVVVISPHTLRPSFGISSWLDNRLDGNFSRFGAAATQINCNNDTAWLKRFREHYHEIFDLALEPLDHGALVPLYFLKEAGWEGPTVVLGLPFGGGAQLEEIGEAIKKTCLPGERTALIASGDMSHCLIPSAPAGYDPAGAEFDERFVDAVRATNYQAALDISPTLQRDAKQDVVASCAIAWHATDFDTNNAHFYSYEGPFGVGYTVMKFCGGNAAVAGGAHD
ncbi:class III extradiol dioxygenase subunit B-like domain-containing protein [Acanthopleuribacter pedis]|uniref:Extradiol ring-cleavage dioxygenase class III enzyme subunit B domain-containing protein n=1 Tax=Acanthopleuribacter pedis TaxID=442870 RepID=A0A8J7QIH3_9BACT|nr:class III extradiol dioxygenase subunit B-like domain-containing protein [Acanthopleuribacter pedis]MBO1320945.1 hypothetical protein [Acanthopleuribacter pedis]